MPTQTSAPQTIATSQVWDYIYAAGDPSLTNAPGVAGAAVSATLQFDAAISTSPIVYLGPRRLQATTDDNGFWSMNLVPNTAISPSGTTWLITTPFNSYEISVGAAGPYQSSSILVNQPSTISPSVTGLTGPITVTGNETVTGNLSVQGTTSLQGTTATTVNATSLTATSETLSGTVTHTGTDTITSALFKGIPWYDVKAYGALGNGLTDDSSAIQSAINAATGSANGGIVFFPPGTYIVNSATLALGSSNLVTIMGCGRQSIIKGSANPLMSMSGVNLLSGDLSHVPVIRDIQFQITSTNGALAISNATFAPATFSPSVIIEGVHFNAINNGSVAATLLTVTDASNLLFANCTWISHGDGLNQYGTASGVVLNGVANSHFTNCVWTFMVTGLTAQKNVSDSQISQGIFLTNCHLNGCVNAVVTNSVDAPHLVNCMLDVNKFPLSSTLDRWWTIEGCYIGSNQGGNTLDFQNPGTAPGKIIGNQIQLYSAGGNVININGSNTNTVNNWLIANNIIGGSAPVNQIALNFCANTRILGNQLTSVPSGSKILNSNPQGSNNLARDNEGYNPVGLVTAPTLTSGSPSTNTFPHYVRVYVSGTVTGVAINSGPNLSTTPGFAAYLAPGETLTVTGTGVGWAWYGD